MPERPFHRSFVSHVTATPAPVSTGDATTWRPLGEMLVERALITRAQLEAALLEQRQSGVRLGEIIFTRGWVSAADLMATLADQQGVDLRVEPGSSASQTNQRPSFSLGSILIQQGQITEAQLDAALAEQSTTGERVGEILLRQTALSPAGLAAALAKQLGLRGIVDSRQSHVRHQDIDGAERLSWFEVRVREVDDWESVFSSESFLDATDLAFSILNESDPHELIVFKVDGADLAEICMQYPPAPARAA